MSTGQLNSTQSFLQLSLVIHPPFMKGYNSLQHKYIPNFLRRPLAPKVKQTRLGVVLPVSPLLHQINSSCSQKAIIIGKGKSLQENPERSKCTTVLRVFGSFIKFLLWPWFPIHHGSRTMKITPLFCLFCTSLHVSQGLPTILISEFSNSLMPFVFFYIIDSLPMNNLHLTIPHILHLSSIFIIL